MMQDFDWSHLQSFLAVAEQGSLSSAARAMGNSQPTVGRHINALEKKLGVHLFERNAGGLKLTDTGVDILDYARTMAGAATHLSLVAGGRAETIAGPIRITASEIVATYILPDILTALHLKEPEIEIELVASNRSENLLQRDADIAVRMYRPTQADVISKKVGALELGLFAAHDYLDRRGIPETIQDLKNHDIIGYDRNDLMINGFRVAGLKVDRNFFPFRCDNQVVCWQMVTAGFGIGFNQVRIGEVEPRVRRLAVDAVLPVLPVWLTAHVELKSSRRVRRVFDFLGEKLQRVS